MLKSNIKVALDFLNGNGDDYLNDKRGYIYGYTNEELDKFYKELPIKDSNVLTIGASGDQILCAVLEGAKKIDAFDYNPYAVMYSNLRVAAVKALSQDEYNSFFYNKDHRSLFHKELYSKIRLYLDPKSLLFWDTLYQKGRFDINYENLILNFALNQCDFGQQLKYFSDEDSYYKTKENLHKIDINIFNSDFFKVIKHLNKKELYDVMILSNIYDWFNPRQKKLFLKYVNSKLSNYLNEDGIISLYSSVKGKKDEQLLEDIINCDNITKKELGRDILISYKKTR